MSKHVVTVFGGSGFLGRHVVRRLASSGAIVRVAVRDPVAAEYLKPMGDVGQIVPIGIDIRHPHQVAAAVAGAETVINLVGILYQSGQATFDAIQRQGAHTIAAAAKASGVKQLVHISALGADAASQSDYARSKAAGEDLVRQEFPSAVIFRPSIVFGPEDNFFNRFAGIIRISPFLPVFGCPMPPKVSFLTGGALCQVDLFGDGGTRFQPVYVGDVADAIMAALQGSTAAGRTFDLGGPTVYSFKQLMELLLAVTRRRRSLLPVPFLAATIAGFFLEMLPNPLLTRDQVTLMAHDNIVAKDVPGLADLGISATPAEAILPTYLARYRPVAAPEPGIA